MLALGVGFYLALTLIVGYIASRRVKNNRDFALAGKNLSYFMATSTVFATWFGSETVLGSSANFMRSGFSGVIEEPFGAALCLILVGTLFAKKLYAMDLTTFSDFFKIRFGVAAEIVSSVILAVSYVSWVAAQFLALGIVLQTITGLSLEVSVVAMAALVTIYTTMGGMWAVSITDTLQTVVIVAGLGVVFVFLLPQAGGFSAVLAKTPATHFSFLPQGKINWFNYAALWMVLGLGSVPGQDVFQRVMASKSGKIAARSSVIAGILYLTVAMIPLFLGLIAAQLLSGKELPTDAQYLLPQVILLKTPPYIQILFFGALISAILSTASGALLAPSVLVSENLVRKFIRDERKMLLVSRISTVLIALWALQATLATRHIHNLVMESSAMGLVSLLVPFVIGFFTKNRNPWAAVASMVVGFLVWKTWPQLAPLFSTTPEDFPAAIAGLIASGLPYSVVWIRKSSSGTSAHPVS